MEAALITAILAGIAAVLKLVFDHLNRMTDKHNEALETLQARNEKFLGNHMSSNTKALEHVAERLADLVQEGQHAHHEARLARTPPRGFGTRQQARKEKYVDEE